MTSLQRCRVFDLPGTPGAPGAVGADGAPGGNAWASLVAPFAMPAQLGSDTASFDDTTWMAVGEPIFIEGLGVLIVSAISQPSATLMNPQDGSGLYAGNAAPGTIVPSTSRVTPTGFEGPTGAVSGVAGGDLTGNYPDPLLKNTGTPGTYGNATNVPVLTTDAAGRVTAVTNTPITFPAISGAAGGDLTGTYPNPTLGVAGVIAGSYGSEILIPQITFDAKGRATAAANKRPRQGLICSVSALDLTTPGDQPIAVVPTRFAVSAILLENASANLTTGTLGIFAKVAGVDAIAADQPLTTLSTSGKQMSMTLAGLADVLPTTAGFIYARVGTGQAATLNLWIFGWIFS